MNLGEAPQLFRHGPSAYARLAVLLAASFVLLLADRGNLPTNRHLGYEANKAAPARKPTAALPWLSTIADQSKQTASDIRYTIALVAYPVQALANTPWLLFRDSSEFTVNVKQLQAENAQLKKQQLADSQQLQQLVAIRAENRQLRQLLGTAQTLQTPSLLASIQYEARDPYSRKIIIDKGQTAGIAPGQPVMDDRGLLGQITRVFTMQSEVSLITDKNQVVPVQVARNGMRAIAYGGLAGGLIELKFTATNADIQPDDLLITSGLDGLYPPGIPVAKVLRVEREEAFSFARVVCEPVAGVNRHRDVLVLMVKNPFPPPPEPVIDRQPRANRVPSP